MVEELRPAPARPPEADIQAMSDGWLLERIAGENDEQAFAVLVQRHSRVVRGVCQRVLQNVHDAEDAFQATFVVLWCKAGSIATPELLGNWLYGVAFRTAQKLRTSDARRRNHELRKPVVSTVAEDPWRDHREALDDELLRLPDKYRMPLILCYLDGKTHAEVARTLGWPIGSVSARMARGLQLMRERLARRNPAMAVALPALLEAERNRPAWIPKNCLEGIFQALAQPETRSPVKELATSTAQAMDRSQFWGKALMNALMVSIGGGVVYNGVVIGAMMANRAPQVSTAATSAPPPVVTKAKTQPVAPCHIPKN